MNRGNALTLCLLLFVCFRLCYVVLFSCEMK